MAENLYFPAYFRDWGAIREAVTPEQGWRLFTACLDYAEHKQPLIDTDPVNIAFFKLLCGGIDRSRTATEEKTRKKRYARYCGICKESGHIPLEFEEWTEQIDNCRQASSPVNSVDNPIEIATKSKSESNDEIDNRPNADKPPRATRFIPPTVEEVTAYCQERKNCVDAHRFVDFYASKGWKVGKENMRDWKAAVRTWEHRDKGADISSPDRYSYSAEESL